LTRAVLALAIALCALGCQPSASFQPEGACAADGRAAGTYPQLEAKLPGVLGEAGATSRDSGRSCSDQRLSTLKAHGVTDLRYAGATWTPEGGSQTVIAVFTTPPGQPALEAGWMQEFYRAGAQASTKTENITVTQPTMPDAGTVWRLDTLNDLSFQTVVVWPGDGLIHVVIVATQLQPGGLTRADHDNAVGTGVHWATTPGPS
jgi:hypothetical protein